MMEGEQRYVSPDGRLVFLVVRKDDDVILGFEGSDWHTHGDILASLFAVSVEHAVKRFVEDLLGDQSVIGVGSMDGVTPFIWVEDGFDYPDEEFAVERRYWSGARPAPL